MQQEMEAEHAQKTRGDDAFREGRYEEANARYSAALEEDERHAPTLSNRSLAALKLGRPEDALEDAEAALQLLNDAEEASPASQLTKAMHRKAEALLALGELLEAMRTYRQGLAACPGSPQLHAALRLAAEDLPIAWLAKYWARRIEAAQAPNPLSSRDGRLIKPVPPELRLSESDLVAHLQAALYPLQDEARDLLCEAWALARRPGRADTAFLRGAAYLAAANPKQALKDARVALVYGPQLDDFLSAEGDSDEETETFDAAARGAIVPSTAADSDSGAAANLHDSLPPGAAAGRRSAWPAALALQSAALEALTPPDNVLAALSMARAAELEPDNEEYAAALERLMRRIPELCAAALQSGGALGLEAQLAGEREAAKPEYLKQRPKNYYYFEWMKKRILTQYPELPEPVMDKMLALEANELDMVLQYPAATALTVERLMDVYRERGPEQLETYAVPLLSWDDYQAIREEDAAAPQLPAAIGGTGTLNALMLGDTHAAAHGGDRKAGVDGGASMKAGASMDLDSELCSNSTGAAAAQVPGAASGGLLGAGDGDEASEAGSFDLDELCGLD